MNDPHVLRYADHLPTDLREPLADPYADWVTLPDGTALHLYRHPAPTSAARATVVVLHGAGGHGRMLAGVGVLAQQMGARAVAPDLPGYGHTVVADRRAVRYSDWVDAATTVVEAEAAGGDPVVVVGASMGGRLALDVAHRLGPGAIDAVVATCLLDPRRPEALRVAARHEVLLRAGLPLLHRFARLTDRVLVPIRWIAPIENIANDPALAAECASDPLGAGGALALGFLRSWIDHEPGYEPASFAACPVVLAHPGEDRWTPLELSRSWFDELEVRKELVVLEGCGHFPVEPDGFAGIQQATELAMRWASGVRTPTGR